MEKFKYTASIIVPVYNAEKYLEKCLDSLVLQTMNHEQMEVLLINDGSKDESLRICQEYAQIYPFFKVIDKENEGVSATRNLGIQMAQGKYILYLDSDDTLSKSTISSITEFFDKHYEEIDEVTYPIIRYQNGKKLPLHFRYKYMPETKVYDLDEVPFILQSNMNICVKNLKGKNLLFDSNPDFKIHEDQAYNCDILENKLKIGFVKEAEYQYNRDNEESAISNFSHAIYTFETSTSYFERLFQRFKMNEVPKYYQALFFHDIAWKFSSHCLWPYHYDVIELKKAKQRIYKLLESVDVNIIMQYPALDNYQKLYWLRQKKNSQITALIEKNHMGMVCKNSLVYARKDIEVILKRILIQQKFIKIVGFYKSPFFSMVDDCEFYILRNGKKENIKVNIASSSYYKSKELTDKFWGFEHTIVVNEREEIEFKVQLDGIELDTSFYNTDTVAFHRKETERYAVNNILAIQENNNKLVFQKISDFKEIQTRNEVIQNIKNDKTEFMIRKSYEELPQEKIWLYYDNYTVDYDNGYYQFIHDFEKKDGIKKYYVFDGKQGEKIFEERHKKYIVKFGSLQHKLLYLKADKIITAFIENSTLNPFIGKEKNAYNDLINSEIIYLQHGILHAHMPWYYTPIGVQIDKIVISSQFERENLVSNYNFLEENVLPFGMPRYEKMNRNQKGKNKIIFAPSWRSYLIGKEMENGGRREASANKLIESNYYKNIIKFVNSVILEEYLEKHDIILELKLHPNFYLLYENIIEITNPNVRICENKVDLAEYNLFITDFSSYVFDYAYLKRPILYYVPDYLEFKSGMNHYRELDLPFEKAFGPLTTTPEKAVEELIKICDKEFQVENKYLSRMEKFYLPIKDSCEKIYYYLLEN